MEAALIPWKARWAEIEAQEQPQQMLVEHAPLCEAEIGPDDDEVRSDRTPPRRRGWQLGQIASFHRDIHASVATLVDPM